MQPLQNNELHPPENLRVNQIPESHSRDEEQQALCSNTDRHHIPDDEEQEEHHPDPPEDQPEVQEGNQGSAAAVDNKETEVQDLQQMKDSVDGGSSHNKHLQDCLEADTAFPEDADSNRPMGTADEDETGEAGGSVPSLVVTETEERRRAAAADPVTPVEEAAPQKPERPSDLATPAGVSVSSLTTSSDGGDMTCCDLVSLRSDSVSFASESNVFKRSEEDDTRSVTTSSIMSLFHRVPLDPLEKEWLKSSAVGNMAAQRRLLAQEPGLVSKKDFITTALHWAAKHGRQEAVDMMLRSGADVNVRSGYTALHLASIHGHQDVVQTLINTYNARTSVRDYHGRTAAQYWSGSTDVFNKADSQSGGRCVRRQQTQRYGLPSLLLSRSRSQGQLNLQFKTPPQSASHDALDLHV